ncbi:MAG TPA: arylesterase [Burkholderiaceae bacterium]|nr:arylesterase [Burkholderiaceae bacterium]HSC01048.1 arylesterase [Burkholderiaceae bacterium]
MKRTRVVPLTRRAWLAQCSLTAAAFAGAQAWARTTARPTKVLVVGDSLSAEYGLARGSGWVALLEQRLQREKVGATVVNASISGDTSSGGRTRLPTLLEQHKPTHVIIELGSNDALRGLPLAMTRDNLAFMLRAVRGTGAQSLLVGMRMPPNYGRTYTQEFESMYAALAKAEGAALVPFMLAGVADSPQAGTLFQDDRMHPNAQAQPIIFDNIWPVLRRQLR